MDIVPGSFVVNLSGAICPLSLLFLPIAADPLALTLSLLIYNSNRVCCCPPLLTHHHPDDTNAAMIDINMLLRGALYTFSILLGSQLHLSPPNIFSYSELQPAIIGMTHIRQASMSLLILGSSLPPP